MQSSSPLLSNFVGTQILPAQKLSLAESFQFQILRLSKDHLSACFVPDPNFDNLKILSLQVLPVA